jgi:arylsulfatase
MPPQPSSPAFRPGAPNVLVILLDDLGFAQLGCYGSDIDTPNLDALAANGVRFTNFHTTAVCSPTRACLLTGRNHHRVGMGMLPDMPMNFPGYRGEFPAGAGTLAQVLRAEGYATYAIGKWHLVPRDQRAAGPFHMWPTGVGFERYYGFLNGETNQWTPNLIRDQHHIEPPATPDDGYHLEADLADQAIAHLRELRLSNPDRPFFLWYASGAPHAPHQAPSEWIERYRGRFHAGWDVWRADVLERQKRLGLVPEDVALPPLPEWVEAWNDIDRSAPSLRGDGVRRFHQPRPPRRASPRLEATVARQHHRRDGERQRASTRAARTDHGTSCVTTSATSPTTSRRSWLHRRPRRTPVERPLPVGLGARGQHRSTGSATFEGGVRPFIVSWPDGLQARRRDPRAVRPRGRRAPHAALAARRRGAGRVGRRPPDEPRRHLARGHPRRPRRVRGAHQPVLRVLGKPRDVPRRLEGGHEPREPAHRRRARGHHRQPPLRGRSLSLFDTRNDPTELVDLAGTHPEKLAELVDLWHREAERNDVFPLDDSSVNRMTHMALPWVQFGNHYDLIPGDKVHESNGPLLFGGFAMVARFTEPLPANVSGTIVEQGDWISGLALVCIDGELVFVQHTDGHIQRTQARVPAGAQVLRAWATPAAGGGFDTAIAADDTTLATGRFHAIPASRAPDGAFLTVGYSRPFPVIDDYQPPFPAPASLASGTVTTGPPPPFDLDAEMVRVMRHQ